MDRRSFLLRLCGPLCAPSMLLMLPKPPPAHAQEEIGAAGAVVAIASLASQIIGMMKTAGPNPIELQILQTEMAQALSSELHVVNDGILKLLDKMEDVNKLLEQTPEQAVLDLYRTNVEAQNLHYVEVLATYSKKLAASSIEAARSVIQDELKTEVVNKMREARLNLQTSYYYASIPAMCTSAFVETHGMIMLSTDPIRIDEALQAYIRWFDKVLDGAEPFISLKHAISDQTGKYAAKKREYKNGQRYSCHTLLEPPSYAAKCYGNAVGNNCAIATVLPTYIELSKGPLFTIASEMRARNLLSASAIPVEAEAVFSNKVEKYAYRCNLTGETYGECPEQSWTLSCNDLEKSLATQYASAWNIGLQLEESKLLALYALKDAGVAGRAFVTSLSKKLRT